MPVMNRINEANLGQKSTNLTNDQINNSFYFDSYNTPDMVCFSHLRWDFVYQRPQHLFSRFSRYQKVFFVEEPIYNHTKTAELVVKKVHKGLAIVTPYLNAKLVKEEQNAVVEDLLKEYLSCHLSKHYNFWYYTPMALEFTRSFEPTIVIYDCMDELSHFAGAPKELLVLESELLSLADVVFTGGNSIYKSKKFYHHNIYPMPSSIDKEHFSEARNRLSDPAEQRDIPRPRFGFYGVIDERMDIELLREVANMRPDWQLIIIGPVVKIDANLLPRNTNIHYLGSKTYQELPSFLSNWDVAIMPFALNDATKYISPTKTPEFLAAGVPVVSTPITDVVSPYADAGLVHIGRTADDFVSACEKALRQVSDEVWLKRVDSFLANMSWDKTYEEMQGLILACESRWQDASA